MNAAFVVVISLMINQNSQSEMLKDFITLCVLKCLEITLFDKCVHVNKSLSKRKAFWCLRKRFVC